MGDGIDRRVSSFESLAKDLSFKMDTLQEQTLKHARITNDTLAKEFARTEKIISTLEQYAK